MRILYFCNIVLRLRHVLHKFTKTVIKILVLGYRFNEMKVKWKVHTVLVSFCFRVLQMDDYLGNLKKMAQNVIQ